MQSIKQVAGLKLLYVMATDAEYGKGLKDRFIPLICGVGPVEAAMNVTRTLSQSQRPDLVISLGSAGSSTLKQGSIYQVSSVSYRDMDASAFGFEKGQTPFLDVPVVVPLVAPLCGIEKASLSTGANVVSGEGYSSVDADMVDMETWAIMRVCKQFDVPLIGLRGISDGAKPVAELSDWTRYLELIDERLSAVVDQLEDAIGNGEINLPLQRFS